MTTEPEQQIPSIRYFDSSEMISAPSIDRVEADIWLALHAKQEGSIDVMHDPLGAEERSLYDRLTKKFAIIASLAAIEVTEYETKTE